MAHGTSSQNAQIKVRDMNSVRGRVRSGGLGGIGSRKKFVYRKKNSDVVKSHATQKSGDYDFYLSDGVQMFSPKPGTHVIRILPDTWEDSNYFGYPIYVHFQVGVDNYSYLCLNKMKGEPCPVCEERRRAQGEGDTEYASRIAPVRRIAVWLIDRDEEKDGPKLWPMPSSFDTDLAAMLIDRRTNEVLAIDHPEEGYDVEFTREGSGTHTKYVGKKVDRHPTPLHKDLDVADKWLEYVVQNPIPSVLKFYSYEHIATTLHGTSGPSSSSGSPGVSKSEDGGRRRMVETEEFEDELPVDDESELEEEIDYEEPSFDIDEEEDEGEEISRASSRIADRFRKRI